MDEKVIQKLLNKLAVAEYNQALLEAKLEEEQEKNKELEEKSGGENHEIPNN